MKKILIIALLAAMCHCPRPAREKCDMDLDVPDKEFVEFICSLTIAVPRRYADETEEEYARRVAAYKDAYLKWCALEFMLRDNCLKKNDGYYLASPI